MRFQLRHSLLVSITSLVCLAGPAIGIAGTDAGPVQERRVMTIAMGQKPAPAVESGPATRDTGRPSDTRQAAPPPVTNITASAVTSKTELKKALAKSIRDEAYVLQQRGQYPEAIERYRQSFAYWPDPALDAYIQALEKRVRPNAAATQAPPVAQTAGAEPVGQAGNAPTLLATIRNRSLGDVNIFVAGETSGPVNLVTAGDIITRAVPTQPGSPVIFYAAKDGKVIATKTWYINPNVPGSVPSLLFDDNLQEKLSVMTAVR
jgi:hypothetical protein